MAGDQQTLVATAVGRGDPLEAGIGEIQAFPCVRRAR